MFRKKSLLETIDVSQSMNLGFDDGWHHPEPDGYKWMNGPSSTIRFNTDGTKKYLEIGCWAGKTVGHQPYTIHIYINGKLQYKCLAPGNGSMFVRSFPLPKHGRGKLKLEFRSEYVWSPSEIESDSPDTRRLGAMALRYAYLKNSINGTDSLGDDSKLLESIDVRKTGDLGFKDGWNNSEPVGHKWMDGPNSTVCFRTNGEKKFLEIGYLAGGIPGSGPHEIEVYANGLYLDAFTVAGNRSLFVKTFRLPMSIRGDLLIEFRSDCVWKPVDIDPTTTDPRQLGALGLCYAVLQDEPDVKIVNQQSVEREIKEMKTQVSTGPSFMIHGVTNRCNLNCVMCGNNNDDPDLVRGDITEDRLSKVRDAYPYLNFASLSGGEPFLFKEIGDLIKELSINGVRNINFYSNGLLLNQAKRELILEYSDNIDFIAISIDAATEGSYKKIRGGNFQRLIENIRELTRRKAELGLTRPRLAMNFVVTRTNVEEIPALVELAAELNVEEVALQQMLEGWDFTVEKNGFKFDYKKENVRLYPELLTSSVQKAIQIAERREVDVNLYPGIYDLYVAQLRESRQGEVAVPRKYIYKNRAHDFSSRLVDKAEGGPICKLPWQMMVLVSSGNAFPCCWSASFGNIDDYESFEDLWNCDRMRKIRHELLNGRFAQECRTPNCPAFKRGESVDLTTL